MAADDHSGNSERFYGRRRGKTLRALQVDHIARDLPALAIDIERDLSPPLEALFTVPVRCLRLEIGFGSGEHLVAQAQAHPDIGHIGAEAFLNGVATATAAVTARGLGNVRLYGDDVLPLLDRLPAASLDRVDLLYPDPWPKRRHWKRRFVRPSNLDRLARIIAPGGHFRFATDVEDYAAWTLRHLLADERFEWTARRACDWREPWPGWPGTRYEAKALREGRTPAYFEFRRR